MLNVFYSTNILSPIDKLEIAKYINEKIEDNYIIESNPVELIRMHIPIIRDELKKLGIKYTPHSFLTKYCALLTHYQEENCLYPIYDSLVVKVLQEEKQKKIRLLRY